MPSPLPENKAATVAVVCVECQNGMLGPDAALPGLAADAGKLVQNLSRSLYAARGRGIRVVHATYEGTSGGRPTGTARLWRALGPAIAEWGPRDGHQGDDGYPHRAISFSGRDGLFPILETELFPALRDLAFRPSYQQGCH